MHVLDRQPGIVPYYHSDDHGGGLGIGKEFVPLLRERYNRKWNHCLEWCSGPGFIGFDILSSGLCEKLTLQDKHKPLKSNIQRTIGFNQLSDNVSFYIGDTLDCIPEQKFDLVVANPPHYCETSSHGQQILQNVPDYYHRIAIDENWQAHRDFFARIPKYLAEDGIIILQENQLGSLLGPMEFWHMINENNLCITAYWTSKSFWKLEQSVLNRHGDRVRFLNSQQHGPMGSIYYIEIMHSRASTNNL